ncbi:MAG: VOC family protein [Candidatus Omnitrophica bacterium]|nr:VOC family protein [Candidatus Omnitrophota bacterium]
MKNINPYLHFKGNAEEAFNFYKSVFGGEFTMISHYKDIPSNVQQDENHPISEKDAERILHMSLPIGKENMLMGGDCPSSLDSKMVVGDNVDLSINTESEEETERLFNQLSQGGKVIMPLGRTFWNAYFGMLTDKFGINWMLSYEYSQKK